MHIAIRAILPRKKVVDVQAFKKARDKALNQVAAELKKDFESTVRTWEERVSFAITRTPAGVLVSTDNVIYNYVNSGVPPHLIQARTSRGMTFQIGYTAKTSPGIIGSTPGGPFGPYRVGVREVYHPGYPARRFDTAVAIRRRKSLAQYLSQNFATLGRK